MEITKVFTITLIVQLFFAVSITLITYAFAFGGYPLDYVTSFSDLTNDLDLEGVSNDIQSSVQDQLNIPVIELGALVFYSGNILVDLLLNFFYAIPEMFRLLLEGFTRIFDIETGLFNILQIFLSVILTTLYFIGLIQLLINVRSGGARIV
jgi:hypothetical protein